MKIETFELFEYSLELQRPFLVRGQTLLNRKGSIIYLKSDSGAEGFGEVAPLPGFSRETLAESIAQIQLLKRKLTGQEIPEQLANFNGQFDRWLGPFDLKPSARFGFEGAVLLLLANARGLPLYQLIPGATHHKIRVTGLLSGTQDAIKSQAEELIEQGYTELKLKVGAEVDEAISNVRAVNEFAEGKALLHVDVNQGWHFDQALAFGKEVGCAALNYIEEPFKDLTKIPEFYDQTLIPVALDESMQYLTLEEIKPISGVEVIVLKPTVLGGIEKILQIMTQAEDFALDTVISSSLESSLGIWTLANMVETLAHNTAAGLDTLKLFKTDVLKQPLTIEHGVMDFNKWTVGYADINFDLLKRKSC